MNVDSWSFRFSMREIADRFSAQVHDKVEIVAGDQFGVAIEGRIVMIGEIESSRLVKRAGTRDLTITGWSSARRLVKSSVILESGRRTIVDQSLEQIVRQVVEPFGIVVDVSAEAQAAASEILDRVRVSNGEKAWAFLQKVAKRAGCIIVSGAASITPDREAKASVQITRSGIRMAPFPLVFPSARVLMIDREDDVRDVHSEYLVTRRGGGQRDPDTGELKGLSGRATDARVLYSPLIIQAKKGGRDQASLDRQAEWELRERAAAGARPSLEVYGWSPNDSQALWWPNTLYRVVDTEDDFDEVLLLASVELVEAVGQGADARLEFLPPDAFSQLNERSISKGKGRRRGYATNQKWLAENSETVVAIAESSDNVDFDENALDLIFIPEDPDA